MARLENSGASPSELGRTGVSQTSFRGDRRTGRILRLAALALLLLVFSIGAFLWISRALRRQEAGIHTDRGTSSPASQGAADIAGYYTLRAVSLDSQNIDSADTAVADRQQWYLRFYDDRSGSACLPGSSPSDFTCTMDQLLLENGISFPYSFSGDTVTVYGSATWIFSRSEEPATSPVADPQDEPDDSGFKCHGYVEIEKHSGKGSLRNGVIEVWGLLGTAENGKQYFELYQVEHYTAADTPVLSLWVERQGDTYVPLIARENAWIFDLWLTSEDTDALTFKVQDSFIRFSYRYVLDKESCNIQILVAVDPSDDEKS